MEATHTDDGGDLSIFASGNEILIACNKGHYWLLNAKENSIPKSERGIRGLHLDTSLTRELTSYAKKLKDPQT